MKTKLEPLQYILERIHDDSTTHEWVRTRSNSWQEPVLIACLDEMRKIKPLREWQSSPWELVLDVLVINFSVRTDLTEFLDEELDADLIKGIIERNVGTDLRYFAELSVFKPYLVEWLLDNWSTAPATVGKVRILDELLDYKLTEEQIVKFWHLWSEEANAKKEDYTYALLTNRFIDHEAFPSYLMEDFLEIVPAGCFSWYAYLVLFQPRFSWLVEKAGGLEVLAEHVDAAAGFQEVIINGFLPVNVRARAALCEYKPLRNNNRYYGFDFMYEVNLILKRDAEKAGLDPNLPTSFLLETLWEKDTPGWLYLTNKAITYKHNDGSDDDFEVDSLFSDC